VSAFAAGVIAAKREAAPAGQSTSTSPPGVGMYLDALTGLLPAEALSLHAVILGFTTRTTTAAPTKVSVISEPTTLKWAFWGLIVLCPILFLAGRKAGNGPGRGTWITIVQCLIPAAAFVAWTMLQKTTAFDAVDGALATGARDTIAVFAAVVLGLVASACGYKLHNKT